MLLLPQTVVTIFLFTNLAVSVSSFQSLNVITGCHRHHGQRYPKRVLLPIKGSSIYSQMNVDYFDNNSDDIEKEELDTYYSNEDEEDDFVPFLTPKQIRYLRKEAAKRKARKRLARVPYDDRDTLLRLLRQEQQELVLVTGIAKNDVRQVKSTVEQLVMELSEELEQFVWEVEIQGHSAILYSPCACSTTETSSTRNVSPLQQQQQQQQQPLKLWTNYKPNQWFKREKAPRDNAGQII
jgi:hypothetical protein